MSLKVLFILWFHSQLLWVCNTTQSEVKIVKNCNEDAQLSCANFNFKILDFLSVTWYKLDSTKKLGIIRQAKDDTKPQPYPYDRESSFGPNYSLVLTSVTPNDSGTYECAISANVGGKNHNPTVHLTVKDCETQAGLTTMTMTTVLDTTLMSEMSTTSSKKQVEELPMMWSIMAFVAVGIIKLVLFIISIWVIRAVRVRSSKRRQQKWWS